MEQRRKQYANETKLIISRLEKAQLREEESLRSLKNLNIPQELLLKKQQDLEDSLEKRRLDINNLYEKDGKYLSGDLDEEIKKELTINKQKEQTKSVITVKKKIDRNEGYKGTSVFSQKFFEKNTEKDFAYGYKSFYKAVDTLPDYIKKNLAGMPNNKGYIWRSCWFFGPFPAERNQPLIMFEKIKGGMHIHEIDATAHKVFEKIGQEKKRLLSSSQLRKTKNDTNNVTKMKF